MSNTGIKPHWLIRLIRALVIAQVAYLILLNLALQVPLTQVLINAIKPEKFHVSWENAWTWYPFRVHAVGVAANGQSRSQQWQFSAPSAAASISILPLVLKRVWISNVVISDIDYKQRPRLKPDKDYQDLIPFFPSIEGRDVVQADTTPRKKKRPWRMAIDRIRVSGSHSYWIMQFKGKARGDFQADLTFETAGGPFSLSNNQLDLTLDTLYVSGSNEVFKRGVVKGEMGFTPFVPKDNKGINLLKFLTLDADINIDVHSLAFINLFTRNFNQMTIDGSGQLDGHFAMEQGQILGGTDISIDADQLQVNIMGHDIQGRGAVDLDSDAESASGLQLTVQYEDLQVIHQGDKSPLLTGENLTLQMSGPGALFQATRTQDKNRKMSLVVEGLKAPDLALFGHYLPEKWPLQLYGGEGRLQGMVSLSSDAVDIDLSITSEKADIGVRQYRFDTNLDTALKLKNTSISSSDTSIAGSYIKLDHARLAEQGGSGAPPWNASFVITAGSFGLFEGDQKQGEDKLSNLLQLVGKSDSRELLGNLHGFMAFESYASSLAWIGILLNDRYLPSVAGKGELNGVVKLAAGLPAPGTDIEILSDSLAVDVLDYTSSGSGKITLRVDEGNPGQDWFLQVVLSDADLMRQNETQAYIQNVDLNLTAIIENMSRDKNERNSSLSFKILSANVTDMSVFSSYLPADSPLRFTNGAAALAADILLQKDDARGWVNLESTDLELSVVEQSISADLSANIKLVGGVPAEMKFDISGSQLSLTGVRVIGDNQQFDQPDWSANFKLLHGETTWKKPLKLNAEAIINIADSRPVVAMFDNKRESPEWVQELLTIEDIEGTVTVAIADQKIVIPLAHALSDKVEVGAKGSISDTRRDGVVYARYKKLDAVIKIADGKKNIDLIRARQKYEDYVTVP